MEVLGGKREGNYTSYSRLQLPTRRELALREGNNPILTQVWRVYSSIGLDLLIIELKAHFASERTVGIYIQKVSVHAFVVSLP